MRELILFADVTLDGFMAGPDNDLGFTTSDDELAQDFVARAMDERDAEGCALQYRC